MNEVQLKLRELNNKGWTDAAIADELGVSNMTVFRWQKGLRSAQNSLSVLYTLEALLERKRIPKRKRRGVALKVESNSLLRKQMLRMSDTRIAHAADALFEKHNDDDVDSEEVDPNINEDL